MNVSDEMVSLGEGREVLEFVEKMGANLRARKAREALVSEIRRNKTETEYLIVRRELLRPRVAKPLQEIRELEERLIEPRSRLRELQSVAGNAERQYAEVAELEEDLEGQMNALEEKQEEVERLTDAVVDAARRLGLLESRYEKVSSRRGQAEQRLGSMRTRCTALETEIHVMTTTRDLLDGAVPEAMSAEDFATLQGDDVGKRAENYRAEVEAEKEAIRTSIAKMEDRIEQIDGEEESLGSQEVAFQRRVGELQDYRSTDEERAALSAEVRQLGATRERLLGEAEKMAGGCDELGGRLADLQVSIDNERRIERAASERLAYLESVKREAETMVGELPGLERELRTLEVEAETEKDFVRILDQAREVAASENRSLRSQVEAYDRAFAEAAAQIDWLVRQVGV